MGELLSELLQKMPVAVMSGASLAQFETQFLPAFPETARFDHLYLFPTNAAECFVHKEGAWSAQYDKSFNAFEKARIMQALKEAMEETGFGPEPQRPAAWGPRIEDRGAEITFSALGQHAPVEEKRAWDPTREKRRPLYEALLKRLPDFSVALNATTSIDITPKGVNKAYGVRRLVEMTGVSVSEMLYVGDALEDGGNDSTVIETGVRTHEVFGPEETAALITDILKSIRLAAV
jgi:HAD superfamily hydrolase (TIGR01484 family)